MKLLLVRHGETPNNVKGILQGHGHGELSALGREQALKLGKRLASMRIDYIYCSDLNRAKQTAEEILKHVTNIPVEYVSELRERSLGEYEGKSFEEYERDLLNSPDAMEFKPKDGESISEMNTRVLRFLNKIEKRHKNQNLLLVTHAGPIITLVLKIMRDKRFDEVFPPNCSLSIIRKEKHYDYKVELLNCVRHLLQEFYSNT